MTAPDAQEKYEVLPPVIDRGAITIGVDVRQIAGLDPEWLMERVEGGAGG